MAKANGWTKTGGGAMRVVDITIVSLAPLRGGGARLLLRDCQVGAAIRRMQIDLAPRDVARIAKELNDIDLAYLVRPDDGDAGEKGGG